MDSAPVEHSYLCIGCGYSLVGIEANRCPECGRAILAANVIAQYSDTTGFKRSAIALCPDRVVVYQSWRLRGDSLTVVRLQTLDPEPAFVRFRPKAFGTGISIALIASMFLFVYFANPRDVGLIALSIISAATLGGLIFALANFRRVEMIQFLRRGTGIVQLTFPRTNRNATELDSFVIRLQEQIVANRS